MRVLVPYPGNIAEHLESILGKEATVISSDSSLESMLAKGVEAEIVASGRVPSEYIKAAHDLRMIQTFGAGIDKIDRAAVLGRDGLLVCNSHINAAEVAEYTIMLLLAAAKRILITDRDLRKGDWKLGWGGPLPNVELRRKTCLLVGLGSVGAEIAGRLRAFDMTLIAATRSGLSDYSGLVDRTVPVRELGEIVPMADFVVLALPLTDESRGLVDIEFLSKMKKSAILVNISRGQIVDEAALYGALKSGMILGAALDVWWDYPKTWGGSGKLPSDDYPFHELENVVVSPHRAAYSENIMHDQVQFAGENILRFIRGEKPQNIVDMALGY